MAEELKGLIEKIHQEGIKVAQDKARQIEAQAERQAQEIVEKAQADAEKMLAEAKDRIARAEESGQTSLEQAGRDLLLSLRKEINAMLDRLILARVRQALSPQEMAKIISALVKKYGKREKAEVVISLKKEDLRKLEKGLLGELKREITSGITLKPSEDILGGFIISYDAGKSYFDFTDKALADYIGAYLKPKLAQILQGAGAQVKETEKKKAKEKKQKKKQKKKRRK